MARRRRVLVLVHEELIPPPTMEGYSDAEIAEWKVEYDVITGLNELGHDVRTLGVYSDLKPIRDAIREFRPSIVFMLLEEFHGVRSYDQAVVSYLELLRQAYTGCNPTGLLLSRQKALAKKIMAYHRIPTPPFTVYPVGRKPKPPRNLRYPLFVKSAVEDASLGIAQSSIVRDFDALIERVRFIHGQTGFDAIAEQYIDGRELYIGILGNQRLQTFPIWEMSFGNMPEAVPHIATARVKWDRAYQEKYQIDTHEATDLPAELVARIEHLGKRAYRALNMTGYGRIDLRLREDGRVFLLEANANPNLEYGEDFAESAERVGVDYGRLLTRIINLGLQHKAPWRH